MKTVPALSAKWAASRSFLTFSRSFLHTNDRVNNNLDVKDEVSLGISSREYAHRRQAFFQRLPDRCMAILPGANRQIRSKDILWPFRQESNIWFLTGFDEPGCIAVFLKDSHKQEEKMIIFCEETDKHSYLWHGAHIGCEKAVKRYGASEAYRRSLFKDKLQRLFDDFFITHQNDKGVIISDVPLMYSSGTDPEVDRYVNKWLSDGVGPSAKSSIKPIMDDLKMCKSPAMQKMFKKSAGITASMFKAAMAHTGPGVMEKTIMAIMDFVAQRHDASGFAYVPVIASGKNALCLHYIKNDSTLAANELLMIDAGADYHYYPTDCTRTWPVSGTFTAPQKDLYSAVLGVQKSLIDRCRPGQRLREMQKLSEQMLLEKMLSIGVISSAESETSRKQLLQTIYPHAYGHPMGIDIHEEHSSNTTVFREGMMHTIEPGIYIPQNDARFPERYRGIGFRIEDNVIVSKSEDCPPTITTESIPKEIEDIEAFCHQGFLKSRSLWDF